MGRYMLKEYGFSVFDDPPVEENNEGDVFLQKVHNHMEMWGILQDSVRSITNMNCNVLPNICDGVSKYFFGCKP